MSVFITGYTLYMFLSIIIGSENQALHTSFEGFTASTISDQNYVSGDLITFPSMVFDGSDNYRFSQYTCPNHGVYYVMVSLRKSANRDINIGVAHESSIILNVAENESGHSDNVVSNSVLVECLRDEIITVRATASGTLDGTSSYKSTTYSVMMIFGMEGMQYIY